MNAPATKPVWYRNPTVICVLIVIAVLLIAWIDTAQSAPPTPTDRTRVNEHVLHEQALTQVWNETPASERESACLGWRLDPQRAVDQVVEGAQRGGVENTAVLRGVVRDFLDDRCG